MFKLIRKTLFHRIDINTMQGTTLRNRQAINGIVRDEIINLRHFHFCSSKEKYKISIFHKEILIVLDSHLKA